MQTLLLRTLQTFIRLRDAVRALLKEQRRRELTDGKEKRVEQLLKDDPMRPEVRLIHLISITIVGDGSSSTNASDGAGDGGDRDGVQVTDSERGAHHAQSRACAQ